LKGISERDVSGIQGCARLGGLLFVALGVTVGCSRRDAEPVGTAAPRGVQQSDRTAQPVAIGSAMPTSATATYVGTALCGECHPNEAKAHRGSDHDRAIEVPGPHSVEAPFSGESFAHDGATTTFSKTGEGYFITTWGADGHARKVRVAYSFGFDPLQQFLVDAGQGRLQAFTVAWDGRTKNQGGQRYFSLYPDERLIPADELHWTRPAQNWNFACADCHSTAFEKRYDAATDSFTSTFAELDVGCEACHGPGSTHVAWSKAGATSPPLPQYGLLISLQRAAAWTIPQGSKSATPRPVGDNLRELETCAPCHSRREQLREARQVNEPYLDAYLPQLLAEGLYQDDGQILGEVYEYGSFLQSRMFHAGVRCSDCHDAHSLELRRPGNALCTGCHDERTFDSLDHHHHPTGAGATCVECHMPQTTYMQVDARRDHSIRLPRPDLGAAMGATDPCTGCHQKKSQAWATQKVEQWFGPSRRTHYATVFHAAHQRDPSAAAQLIALTQQFGLPAIVRATALSLLQNYPSPATLAALKQGVAQQEPLVRLGAAEGARGLDPAQRLEIVLPLLSDGLLAVRVAAARAVADVAPTLFPVSQRGPLLRATEELRKVEGYNADRPEAWLRLALMDASRGDLEQAARSLEQALKLDPQSVPALVNLADLRRSQHNEEHAEQLLRRALEIDPRHAEALHALGLTLIRTQRKLEGTTTLQRALELRPQNARFAYVYAVALGDGGELHQAIAVLRRSLQQHPHDPSLIELLLKYAHKKGDDALVREMAARLLAHRAPHAQAGH